ncbi:hypothetical protein [Campylobacter concisus]|jgi:hypothetical protein|uniref:hypothetical protein n=1 Tax=Campylobacter concisus TaxID=199 RepID=UPI000CD9108D|nr:hypothetical protein [Campylobacter concisus]
MIVDENTREYLKMLQAIITRLNTNSFQIKTIATTIITSFMVFMYEKNQDKIVNFTICVIVFMFWVLDTYFLRSEKAYRKKYNETVYANNHDNGKKCKIYDLDITEKLKEKDILFCKVMVSKTIWPVYVCLMIITWTPLIIKTILKG